MLGAIAGDIIGSVYEFDNIKTENFPLFGPRSKFTDDTVLTVAVADCLLNKKEYAVTFKEYGRRYPTAGYGISFRHWLDSASLEPYYSYGNGSAMRVSPVGFAAATLEEALQEAECSAAVTHNHPEGIKGAQAVAAAIFLASHGSSKKEIRDFITDSFSYNLNRTLVRIRPDYEFDDTCQGTVPEAIIAFLESSDFVSAIRKAISLGGDSDTLACITGGIAQAFYGKMPTQIVKEVRKRLPPDLLSIVEKFSVRFGI
jgi:ADP-ribosyl-[dinitrogen reductase] hydrolase